MILVVDHVEDPHVRVVQTHLARKRAQVFVADPSELGVGGELSFFSKAPERSEWRRKDGTVARLGEVRAIWYRPKVPPTTPTEVVDHEDRRFIQREWSELLRGVLTSLDVPQINSFRASVGATKPRQLAIAHRLGLAIPDTIFTNSAARALEFVNGAGPTVHKVLTPPEDRLLATKEWEEADAPLLDALTLCPIIFQRRIDGTRELRITAVGERLFAAEFSTTMVDGRMDQAVVHRRHELPRSVEQRLLALLGALSLHYAAIDMRIDARGEYQFLEANPAGQYLWIEIRTGMPISEAVADLLVSLAERPHAVAV